MITKNELIEDGWIGIGDDSYSKSRFCKLFVLDELYLLVAESSLIDKNERYKSHQELELPLTITIDKLKDLEEMMEAYQFKYFKRFLDEV